MQVDYETTARQLVLPATLEAAESAVLVPQSAGRVAQVHVRIGDDVKKGSLLLSIVDNDYQIAVTEAKAAMELAVLQAEQAEATLARFDVLKEKGAVTDVQYEEVKLGADLSKGQAKRAQAGYDIAQSRLRETNLRAPFAGTILARNVERGEMMGGPVQSPPLILADLSRFRIRADVGEMDAALLVKGQKVEVFIPSLGRSLESTISRINRAVDPVIKTVQIEAVLSDLDAQLKHGGSAEMRIQLDQSTALSLPRNALLNRKESAATVFVLDSEGLAVKKQVTYGRSEGAAVPILTGVEAGQNVLVSGHHRLKDGDEVLVVAGQ